ncbi:MAG: ABC transporter ATP-binding protein [Hyphomicrobiales bacterium]|nr:ABC transporter ATP-binding protein [Hyphomicrobiales bacterium]
MAEVLLQDVSKAYGATPAVRNVTLRVAPGEFLTLLGPSGCGKTTCLRMVAGFVKPDSGSIILGGRDVTGRAPHNRDAGMVFQSYALFPHKTVAANIAFGLAMRRLARAEIDERVRGALRLVQLEHLADRYPAELSGGQKQRVALARAVVIKPQVLLLDEPLGALDLKLREELQVEIKRVQSELAITTLFVTHDQGEALGMSDRVAVMRDGQIVQIDTPHLLYERPNTEYVANFVGRTNLIDVTVVGRDPDGSYRASTNGSATSTFKVSGHQPMAFSQGERCLLAARPEHFRVAEFRDGDNVTKAKVVDVVYRGSVWNVDLRGDDQQLLSATVRSGGAVPVKGDIVTLNWAPASCFLLKSESRS